MLVSSSLERPASVRERVGAASRAGRETARLPTSGQRPRSRPSIAVRCAGDASEGKVTLEILSKSRHA